MENNYKQWKKDESAAFEGWDFAYIKNRYIEDKPGWDYNKLAKELIRKSSAVLDMATGGGEIFSSFAPFPKHTVAIEGYHPNVAVAQKKLGPLGVKVLEADEAGELPFEKEVFDLILNRHGGFRVSEVHRILKNKGLFLTQQVGAENLADLMVLFGSKPKWPENLLENVREKMENAGFRINRAEKWGGKVEFFDVGALVYFFKAIPWIVDGFSVDRYLPMLEELQKKLENKEKLIFTVERFLVEAQK